MYSNNYSVPMTYESPRYDGVSYSTIPNNFSTTIPTDGERFFLAPFLVGGLAGTALGYGIANNNRPPYPMYPPIMYPTPYPVYTTNYYY